MRRIDYLALSLVLIFGWALFFRVTFFEVFDLKLLDLFYRLRGMRLVPTSVVVVGIDEYSLSAFETEHERDPSAKNDTWPWDREKHGALLQKIFEDGAKVVAFDVSFTEPGESEEGDMYFASTLLLHDKVVLGTYLINDKSTYERFVEELKKKIERDTSYADYAYKLLDFRRMALFDVFTVYKVRPIHERFASSAYYAPYEIGALDSDGVVRRVPLLVNEQWALERGTFSGLIPHMNVLVLALWDNVDPKKLVVDFRTKQVLVGNRKIRFDNSGYMHLWYYGTGEAVFPTLSFYDVYNGNYPKGFFRDKVVLVGYTATAKGLYDLRVTPFSVNEAGVYVHATAVENMIRQEFLVPVTPFQNAVILFVFMCITLAVSRGRSDLCNILLAVLPLGFAAFSYALFSQRVYVNTFYPLFSSTVVAVFKILGDFMRENAEKKKMKEFLYRYVPDNVAEELVRERELKLGGETREVVVLFSDIKGFTSKSEKLSPEQVVNFLNTYLTKMSEIIRYKYEGTIDKFVGDAIMAVFGAPKSYGNEVDRALKCALDMRRALSELDAEYRFDLDNGIGIHCGPAVVGNIGAPFRMDYTCIGDTVNTASRIEHLTRELDAEIIVSEDVWERASGFRFEFLGEFQVRGKSGKLRLYKLLGELEESEVRNVDQKGVT